MSSGYFACIHDKLHIDIVLVDVFWEEGVKVIFCWHFSVLVLVIVMMRMIVMFLWILSFWLGGVGCLLVDVVFVIMVMMTFVCLYIAPSHCIAQSS